jgi:hypothetical protein
MTVVITADAITLASGEYVGVNSNNPLIGYENLTTISNVSATSENVLYPATNLANPATNLTWKAEDVSPISDIYITVVIDRVDDVDYIAIAKHNLGTILAPVSVEGLTDSLESPTNWVELVPDVLLPDDGPALFRFAAQSLYAVRLRIQPNPGSVVPQIAVCYTGKLLVLQRRLYVGHTPINYGVQSKIVNARSESGNFLGRIVLNEFTNTNVSLQNLTPTWVRSQLIPFINASREYPFFFAWRPGDYPYEIGYCWMTNDPMPNNQRPNGMMQVDFKLTGVV